MKQRQHTILRHMQNRRQLLRLLAANGAMPSTHVPAERQGGTEPHDVKPRQQHPVHTIKKPAPAHTPRRTKSTGNAAATSQTEIEQALLTALARGAVHDALIALIDVQLQEYQRMAALYSQIPGSYQRQGGF